MKGTTFIPQIIALIRLTDTQRAVMLAQWRRWMKMPKTSLVHIAKTELEYSKWMLVAHLMEQKFGKDACDEFMNAFEFVGGAQ